MLYLDNASTSFPKPQKTLNAITSYLEQYGVSPGRGSYLYARKAEMLMQETREMLAKIIGWEEPKHLCFTQNATASINTIIKGFLEKNDHVIICRYSHNAVWRSVIAISEEKNNTYDVLDISEEGAVDIAMFNSLIKKQTRLLVVTGASNVIGVKADLIALMKEAKQRGIAILFDSTQSLIYCDDNKYAPYVDFFVGTGHKTLYGPTGIGFFAIKDPSSVKRMFEGGSHGNFSGSPFHPEKMPYKFEAGTPNMIGIAGLRGGLEFLHDVGIDSIRNHAKILIEKGIQLLSEIDGITIYGTKKSEKKVPIISFSIQDKIPSQIAYQLEHEFGICVRAGMQCAPLIHDLLGTAPVGTIRVSFSYFTKEQDLVVLQQALRQMGQYEAKACA